MAAVELKEGTARVDSLVEVQTARRFGGKSAVQVMGVRRKPRSGSSAWPRRMRIIIREPRRSLLAPLLVFLILLVTSCELVRGDYSLGGPSPPPSGSLSVSFIDVGQGDGVLVQAAGTNHLIDAGSPEEGGQTLKIVLRAFWEGEYSEVVAASRWTLGGASLWGCS